MVDSRNGGCSGVAHPVLLHGLLGDGRAILGRHRRIAGISENPSREAALKCLSSLRGTAESERSAMQRLRECKLDDED